MKQSWTTPRLAVAPFDPAEAPIAKRLFESALATRPRDPTFRAYPLEEYASMIRRSADTTGDIEARRFHLRRIALRDGTDVGYFLMETHVPEPGCLWVGMFVLHPEHRGRRIGQEAIHGLSVEAARHGMTSIQLNVYAENLAAFRFWFRNGFDTILGLDVETAGRDTFHCLRLRRSLSLPDRPSRAAGPS